MSSILPPHKAALGGDVLVPDRSSLLEVFKKPSWYTDESNGFAYKEPQFQQCAFHYAPKSMGFVPKLAPPSKAVRSKQLEFPTSLPSKKASFNLGTPFLPKGDGGSAPLGPSESSKQGNPEANIMPKKIIGTSLQKPPGLNTEKQRIPRKHFPTPQGAEELNSRPIPTTVKKFDIPVKVVGKPLEMNKPSEILPGQLESTELKTRPPGPRRKRSKSSKS